MKRLKRSGARLLARAVLSQARSDWEHDVRHHEVEAVLDGKLIERRQAEATLSAHRSEQKMLDEFGALGVQRRR